MPSERQREANRRNGRLGGPKTIEGKERSRVNSLKHGLTSSALVVLPDEDRKEYDELLSGFRDSFEPANEFEDALVVRLAQAHWRGLRSRAVETAMLDTSANLQRREARRIVENCPENLNPHEAIGVGFMIMPAERWQMYLRYDATISREFFKTLDALTKLQRSRQSQKRAASNALPQMPATSEFQPPRVLTAGAGAQLSDSGIRSVSQTRTKSAGPEAAAAQPLAGPKQRRLQRLLAAAQVLPQIARRVSRASTLQRSSSQNGLATFHPSRPIAAASANAC
jgi:hypothetical protein